MSKTFPRTTLAANHMRVINGAPTDMQDGLRDIAIAALNRKYERDEDLAAYLDAEDLYYRKA